MEQFLAKARIYLLIMVFFASCFLGLLSEVSFPMLALRSVAITGIVGILSQLLLRYIIGVINAVPSPENEHFTDSMQTGENQVIGHKKE
jgi:hypothetical protein